MILERGNMMDMWGKTDLFVFTSNPIVNKDGLAVMGRGIAKQVADAYPSVQRHFGLYLLSNRNIPPTGMLGPHEGQYVGFFMVKDHWARPARLDLIEKAVTDLKTYVSLFRRIDLNFPGIGNGKLRREDVLPVIQSLPDTVHVWEYDGP